VVAIEAFIVALYNADLQLEVMKCEPATVEIAVSYAINLEAYEHSLNAVSSDQEGGRAKSHP